MPRDGVPKRAYGSGGLIISNGVYFGKWRINDRQVMRRLGPVRIPGAREGLTKSQAEALLRKRMAEVAAPAVGKRVTVSEAAEHLLAYVAARGRKPSTLRAYRASSTRRSRRGSARARSRR